MAEDANPHNPNIYRVSQVIAIEEVEKKFKKAKPICSSPFFCRHDPQPAIFELGMKFCDGWLCPYVHPLHQNVMGRLLAFTLRDHTGALLKEMGDDKREVFKKDGETGYQEFYKLTGAECGMWRLVCDLEYEASVPKIKNTKNKNKNNPEEGGSCSSLRAHADLLELLATSKNADVIFSVKGEEIRAHRVILMARSSYFAKMFESDMKESRSNEIEVMDTEPKVFRGMLEFLYSGLSPKNLSEIAMKLLSAADKYQLDDLADLCESSIASNLTEATVVDALLLADQHNRQDLLTHATAVFRAQYGALKESKEATDKLKTNPNLLLKLLESFWKE